jgi:hypothetical protein
VPEPAEVGQARQAQHVLLNLGRHAVDAYRELSKYVRGDGSGAGHALELLETIGGELETAHWLVRGLPGDEVAEPWDRL